MKNINIGEKGVDDQCQQETFNPIPNGPEGDL